MPLQDSLMPSVELMRLLINDNELVENHQEFFKYRQSINVQEKTTWHMMDTVLIIKSPIL